MLNRKKFKLNDINFELKISYNPITFKDFMNNNNLILEIDYYDKSIVKVNIKGQFLYYNWWSVFYGRGKTLEEAIEDLVKNIKGQTIEIYNKNYWFGFIPKRIKVPKNLYFLKNNERW